MSFIRFPLLKRIHIIIICFYKLADTLNIIPLKRQQDLNLNISNITFNYRNRNNLTSVLNTIQLYHVKNQITTFILVFIHNHKKSKQLHIFEYAFDNST